MDEAKRTGNRAIFDKAVADAEAATGLLPEQRVKLERDFNQTVAFSSAMKNIDAEPITALESLEDPNFLKQNPDLPPGFRAASPQLRRAARQPLQG